MFRRKLPQGYTISVQPFRGKTMMVLRNREGDVMAFSNPATEGGPRALRRLAWIDRAGGAR